MRVGELFNISFRSLCPSNDWKEISIGILNPAFCHHKSINFLFLIISSSISRVGSSIWYKYWSKNHWIFSPEFSWIKEINSFAKKYAAKEALVKALGTGFRNGINFKNIEIKNEKIGKPYVNLDKILIIKIKQKYKVKKFNIFLSISDENKYAIANILITK